MCSRVRDCAVAARARLCLTAQYCQGYFNDDVILSNTNAMLMMSKKQLDEQEAIWDQQDKEKNKAKEGKDKSKSKPADAPALDSKPAAEKALNAVD